MSSTGLGQRIAVFVVFTALAAASSTALFSGVPASVPTSAELAALEERMRVTARLHPPPPVSAPAGSASWCATCHPGLPHPGSGVAGAMLNEHAGRMDCLLCHWSEANGSRPAPSWMVPAGATAFLSVLPRERSSWEALAALRSAATEGKPSFERGPDCAGCHRPGNLGKLVRPGTTPARAASLERLENYFTLARGEKWYFPQFR